MDGSVYSLRKLSQKTTWLLQPETVRKGLRMTFKEKYNGIFREAYLFLQQHYPPEDKDEYWDNLVAEADDLCRKRPDPFMRDLIVKALEELERTLNNGKRERLHTG